MSPRVSVLVLWCAACHPASPPPPLTGTSSAPAAPAGFATCDLVTLDAAGSVTTWKIGAAGIERTGSAVLGPPLPLGDAETLDMLEPMRGDWADRDHFFVRTVKDTVKVVTAGGISVVPIPDMSKLSPPKPEEEARPGSEGMMRSPPVDLVVGVGEAWWARCAWSLPYDGGYCAVWTSAELWPRARMVTKLADERVHVYPAHDPAGFALERAEALACTAPNGTKTTITHPEDEVIYETAWVSARPPRLLVVYGPMAEFSSPPASSWSLHEGCAEEPIAEGASPSAGVGDLWSAVEGEGFAIYRGATKLGTIPVKDVAYAQLRFRPGR